MRWIKWLEAVLLTALIVIIGQYWFHDDPLFLHAAFPWLWLVPVLLALRYGLGPSLLSILLLFTVYHFTLTIKGELLNQYRTYFLGGFILTLICAEYRVFWGSRLRRAKHVKDYSEQRLDGLAKAYYVVKYSHDHLEQSLIGKPVTLRSAMMDIRELTKGQDAMTNTQSLQRLIELIAYHCQLEQAALYAVKDDLPDSQALVNYHFEHDINSHDSLWQHAIVQKQTAVFKDQPYILAAPMVDGAGQVYALLVVKNIAFLALQHHNIEMLTVMLGYYADTLWSQTIAKDIIQTHPDCPLDFAAECVRLQHLREFSRIKSHILSLDLTDCLEADMVLDCLKNQTRSLDYAWHSGLNNKSIWLIVMPMADKIAVEGLIERLDEILTKRFQKNISGLNISYRYRMIRVRYALSTLFNECLVHDVGK